MTRLRILVLAEEANPEWVSVPLVGFKQVEALAHLHDVTLVTHERNRQALSRQPSGARETIFIRLGALDRLWQALFQRYFQRDPGKQARTAARIPFYLAFEWASWRKLRGRILGREFDVVLRTTPVSPVVPSVFPWLMSASPVPIVIGPLNGGLPFPANFETAASKQREVLASVRHLHWLLPFAKSTYRYAAAAVAGSTWTFRELRDRCANIFFIPENGIEVADCELARAPRDDRRPLELAFVGRLVPFKGCDLAIRGAAKVLASGQASLRIFGEGPEKQMLESLVADLRLVDRVKFMGMVPHEDMMRKFADVDVLVFPSLREFGGGVVFEALAHGVVPIVLDYGGPGDIVDATIGFKLPATSQASVVEGIAQALDALTANRPKLKRMSASGRDFAKAELTWAGKAQRMTAILLWVVGIEPCCPTTRYPSAPVAEQQLATVEEEKRHGFIPGGLRGRES